MLLTDAQMSIYLEIHMRNCMYVIHSVQCLYQDTLHMDLQYYAYIIKAYM